MKKNSGHKFLSLRGNWKYFFSIACLMDDISVLYYGFMFHFLNIVLVSGFEIFLLHLRIRVWIKLGRVNKSS